jgi:hypothetical protein
MIAKYRVWDKKKNCMESVMGIWFDVMGEVERITTSSNKTITRYWRCQHAGHELKNLILLQFTGFLDRNKKEIWEGDVVISKVNMNTDKGSIFEVKFLPRRAAFCLFYSNGKYRGEYASVAQSVELEKIGNVHENKDLLHANPGLLEGE